MTASPIALPATVDARTAIYSVFGFIIVYQILSRLYNGIRDYQLSTSNGCQPPPTYPHKDGVLGLHHLLTLIKAKKINRVPTAFCEMFDDTGSNVNTIGHYVLGKKSYWTRDADNIKAILHSSFQDWGLPPARKATFDACLGGGIFGVDGAEWEHSRAMLKPSFNKTQMSDTATLEKHAQKLITRIPDGEEVDLANLFPLLTMDVGTEMLFGESVDSLSISELKQATEFTHCFDYIVHTISKHMSLPFLTRLPDPKLKLCVDFVNRFAEGVVDQTMSSEEKTSAGGKKKYIFPTELAKMGLSQKQIQIEVINIMFAGRDTTAALLSLIWWYLAKRPDIVSKIRNELEPLGSRAPTTEEVKKLHYLKNVVNEVLRLHPINPLNSRTAIRDTTLPRGGGPDGQSPVFIRKGQQVMFTSSGLQRRPDLYGNDVMELKPERWNTLKPTAFEYIPFGGGPRICPGQHLALLEASYFTVRLLQEFQSVEPLNEGPFQEAFAILVTSGDGVRVRFSRTK
ncbi:cytochrome P450 alkane hydroxylase-like protein [Emericellopsis atlantica]|uniref:Cytochrome P450 alkane hydroxylase-like protein n=1 Tax=Emericellopsis atlantica TaxID=2614577 RepID=A0A9P8CLG6_9HYPO|nr:cytochrome P450 alkane hydroxylase-like protein [Emericellopsis atlantica]KAG9251383.1 cytochrome P450 alkane hydroxylase-like protein [Emericellopsis atlantica]